MANTFTKRIVEDGWRNAVVNLVGILDTAVVAPTQVQQILKADFTNNDTGQLFNGFRIDRVQFAVSSNGVFVEALWDAAVQQPAFAVTESHDLDWAKYSGLQPNVIAAGYTGTINILLNAPNAAAATQQEYNLIVSMVKLYTG